jgi:hypothetical protein
VDCRGVELGEVPFHEIFAAQPVLNLVGGLPREDSATVAVNFLICPVVALAELGLEEMLVAEP